MTSLYTQFPGVTEIHVENEETVAHPLCNAKEFVHSEIRAQAENEVQRADEHRI